MSPSKKSLVWLVTGTSSGIGRELVIAALNRGEKVIATARSTSIHKLEDLRAKGADIVMLDVASPSDELKEIVENCERIHGRIDVLFNNAGYVEAMAIEEDTPEETLDIFNVLVFGGLAVARAVLPGMRARKKGTIVWNGSLRGWEPGQGSGVYSAAKSCIRGLSEALHAEIEPLGLRSLVVEPGYFRTSLTDNVKPYESRIADYKSIISAYCELNESRKDSLPGDPKRLAEVILDLIRGEGLAEGRNVPTILPLGSDCYDAVERACEGMLLTLKTWKDVIVSTDFPKASRSAVSET